MRITADEKKPAWQVYKLRNLLGVLPFEKNMGIEVVTSHRIHKTGIFTTCLHDIP